MSLDHHDNHAYHVVMNYLLRDVDAVLWRKVKVKAARDGQSVRAVLLALLAQYAKEK